MSTDRTELSRKQAERTSLHSHDPASDPLGHSLIERRILAIPALLKSDPIEVHYAPRSDHFVAVGVGSSLGHAQYLAHLMNRFTDFHCLVEKPVSFQARFGSGPAGVPLIFSQGLSENSHAAVESQISRGDGVLFTAYRPGDGAPFSAKEVILSKAEDAGIARVAFPLHAEYEVLVRTIGPFFGYLAAHRFVSSLPGSRLAPLDTTGFESLFEDASETGALLARTFPYDALCGRQCKFVFVPPSAAYCHNLAEKFKEGAFMPRPELCDIEEFDHGAFQNACANKSPVIVFHHRGAEAGIESSVLSLEGAVRRGGIEDFAVLRAPEFLAPEAAIFWYEMAVNHWILHLMKQGSVDQYNWPGKGLEANYGATHPGVTG